MNDQPSFATSDVPQGHLTIARHFSAGDIAFMPQVPKGRQNPFLRSPISNLKSFALSLPRLGAFASLREVSVLICGHAWLSSVAKTLCLSGKKEPFKPTRPSFTRLDQIEPQLRKKIFYEPNPPLPSTLASWSAAAATPLWHLSEIATCIPPSLKPH